MPRPAASPPAPVAAQPASKAAVAAAGLLVVAVAVSVTANALDHPFLLDDGIKIVQNTDIRRLEDLPEKLVYPYQRNQVLERNDPSRPLVFLIYALVWHVAGANPVAFHAVNAFFHALAALLVFGLARRTAFYLTGQARLVGPALAGLLFAATPIQVGTAIYAYALSDVLAAALMLLSLWLFVRRPRPGAGALALSALALALAVFAKQVAVVTPMLGLLFDWTIIGGGQAGYLRGRWRYHALFAAVAVAYTLFRLLYFGEIGDLEGRGNTYPVLDYLLAQPLVVLRYLFSTIVPYRLAIDHHIVPASDPLAAKLAAWAALASLAWPMYRWLRHRTPAARLALFAVGFYLLALAPTSSILPTVDLMVERRVYLANVGLFLLVVLLYDRIGGLAFVTPSLRRAALVVAALHVAGLAAYSVARNRVFRTNEAVWQDVLSIYPDSPRALNNLANARLDAGDPARAKELFERLVQRDPRDYIALGNLGTLHEKEGTPFHDVGLAARYLERAIAVNPDYAAAYYNLARIYQKAGRFAEAERLYLRTLELQPNHVLAHNNLGLLYYHQGRAAEARKRYETALRLDPSCGPARVNLELLERRPVPGAQGPVDVPPSQVPAEILVRLYENALARAPGNHELRRQYARMCLERNLPCARAQYRILRQALPDDPEAARILQRLGP